MQWTDQFVCCPGTVFGRFACIGTRLRGPYRSCRQSSPGNTVAALRRHHITNDATTWSIKLRSQHANSGARRTSHEHSLIGFISWICTMQLHRQSLDAPGASKQMTHSAGGDSMLLTTCRMIASRSSAAFISFSSTVLIFFPILQPPNRHHTAVIVHPPNELVWQ